MRELHLFAGAGGGILGGMLLGHTPVCAVEIEEYPRKVLLQRQRDGILPRFPIWGDICTFDGRDWRGRVDVVCGGFPCQDISAAGKGAGLAGERSGLWSEMARVVSEVRPRYVFVENSPLLVSRGLDVVLGDLTALGYDCRWGIIGAYQAGAPHKRDRCWILANSNLPRLRKTTNVDKQSRRTETFRASSSVSGRTNSFNSTAGEGCHQIHNTVCGRHGAPQEEVCPRRDCVEYASWWATEPDVGRVANGVASRVDRLKAIGNGQVPQCAALAWRILGGPC